MSISFGVPPPISIMVFPSDVVGSFGRTVGSDFVDETMFINSDTNFPPVPVIAMPSISSIWVLLNISFRTRRNVSTDWPCERT